MLGPLYHGPPLGQVGGSAGQAQTAAHRPGQPFLLQHKGHLIEDGGGQIWDHVLRGDIAEQGDLLPQVPGQRAAAPGQDHVGLDAKPQQFLHRVLGGLALELAGARNGHNQGHVEIHHILPAHLPAHLTDGLQEGLGFNVAHGAADLGDDHVHLLRPAHPVDPTLDLVGNVGDDLDGAPQVVPAPLPAQHGPVHLARGDRGVDG